MRWTVDDGVNFMPPVCGPFDVAVAAANASSYLHQGTGTGARGAGLRAPRAFFKTTCLQKRPPTPTPTPTGRATAMARETPGALV
jgi:hypothetical protein